MDFGLSLTVVELPMPDAPAGDATEILGEVAVVVAVAVEEVVPWTPRLVGTGGLQLSCFHLAAPDTPNVSHHSSDNTLAMCEAHPNLIDLWMLISTKGCC
ncbi:MAG: hypothetical protein G01um101472_472 [Parcubacteria group bacterium Gr01-1014_72]|nr:MAG: hypothetical protein G01um101472_472 [Parcubacteria group bacterium Gr01-1014_72]